MGDKKRKCFACGKSNVVLFTFPKDENMCMEWIRNIRCELLKYVPLQKMYKSFIYKLCADHFERKHFFSDMRNRLLNHAVPTIFTTYCFHETCKYSYLNNRMSLVKTATVMEIDEVAEHLPLKTSTSTMEIGEAAESTPLEQMKIKQSVSDTNNKDTVATCVEDTVPEAMLENQSATIKPHSQRTPTIRSRKWLMMELGVVKTSELSPKKQKLLKQLRKRSSHNSKYRQRMMKTRKKLVCLEKESDNSVVSDCVSPILRIMASGDFRNREKLNQGRRWTTDEKIVCLSIFKRSPQAYRFLRRFSCLPSRKTLISLLKTIPFSTGIDNAIFKHLEEKVKSMDDSEKICVLLFDEVFIKSGVYYNEAKDIVEGFVDLGYHEGRLPVLADHALVFMIRGVRRGWKQPLCYYFTHGSASAVFLKNTVHQIVSKLMEMGFLVVGTVCDQGSTNRSAMSALAKEYPAETEGGLSFRMNNSDVSIIYDVCHLLKSTRNNFLNHSVLFKEKTFSWNILKELKALDVGTMVQMMYKLTEDHLEPKGKSKMKVSLATQVLSRTVAGTMNLLAHKMEEPDVALACAEWIMFIDNLFDSLNGSLSSAKRGKPLLRCVSDRSAHLEFWKTATATIQNDWKFINKKTGKIFKPPCQNGWIISIRGVQNIWTSVQKMGFTYLPTRNLNQDPLENLFCNIRQHCGSNTTPTVPQFISALKTTIINKLADSSRVKNCEDDNGKFLSNLHSFLGTSPLCEKTSEDFTDSSEDIDDVNTRPDKYERQMSLSALLSVAYIAGYIARRLLKPSQRNNCEVCNDNLTTDEVTEDHGLITVKEYDLKKGRKLKYPVTNLLQSIGYCINVAENFLPNFLHKYKVRKILIAAILQEVDFIWATCPSHRNDVIRDLTKIFGRMLIVRFCKVRNKELRNKCQWAKQ